MATGTKKGSRHPIVLTLMKMASLPALKLNIVFLFRQEPWPLDSLLVNDMPGLCQQFIIFPLNNLGVPPEASGSSTGEVGEVTSVKAS